MQNKQKETRNGPYKFKEIYLFSTAHLMNNFCYGVIDHYTTIFSSSECIIAIKRYHTRPIAAAIAPWFRLRLPFCGPGFESQAHHLRFFNLY